MSPEYYREVEKLIDRLRLTGAINNREQGKLRRVLYEARYKIDLGGKRKNGNNKNNNI